MAIQMRRGLYKDFDPTKMLPGEWAVAIDSDTNNQVVWMCFAPGFVKRMGTYEDFKQMINDATGEIKEEYISEFNAIVAVAEEYANMTKENKDIVAEYVKTSHALMEMSEDYSDKSKQYSEAATNMASLATSYAVGTNDVIRAGDSTDNAKYYKEQSEKMYKCTYFGVCNSESSSRGKEITIDNLPEDLKIGQVVRVLFTNGNTYLDKTVPILLIINGKYTYELYHFGNFLNAKAGMTYEFVKTRTTSLSLLNTNPIANNLTTTEKGFALDATRGKELDDKISSADTKIDELKTLINSNVATLTKRCTDIEAKNNEQDTEINDVEIDISRVKTYLRDEWDTSSLPDGITISYYTLGLPDNDGITAKDGEYCLDVTTGSVYYFSGYNNTWSKRYQLHKLVTPDDISSIKEKNAEQDESIDSLHEDMISEDANLQSQINNLDSNKLGTETFNNYTDWVTTQVNSINSSIAEKVDKVEGKGLSTNDYSTSEKEKLKGIEVGANAYTHPSTHPSTMITQDSTHRFVTDAEKTEWNGAKNYSDSIYQQSTGYTDQKIAALIDGAPETMDTIKEVADAIAENKEVVDALNKAIGNKANQTELDTHTGNGTIHITATERTNWNDANTKKHTHSNKAVLDATTASYTTSEKDKLNGIETGAQVNDVTGIKGNSESTYRTGNVNITPENIGALPSNGTAAAASKWATARNINGMSVDGTANRTNYGTCSTAAATTAKTVACSGFSLVTGAEITVKFTVTNTASSPTLNVNSTGAKAIYYRGSAISAGYLAANRTYTFRYNGTQYDLVGDINTDTNTNNAVTQTDTESTNADYRILFSSTADDTTRTEGARKDGDLTYNPSTGTLKATKLTGQTGDSKVNFTSGDSTSVTGWTDVSALTSGSTHATILNRISTMMKNVRYLWKLIGSTSISSIGNGTLTGAVSELDSDLSPTIGNFTVCSRISNKPVNGGNVYIGVSFYLPKGYTFNITNVEAVGAAGNFASSVSLLRYGDYIRPSTTNANLADYTLQITGTISKS